MENIQSFEHDYTIPSDNRELQLTIPDFKLPQNYTIPSDNRELQLSLPALPSGIIIPYQVITGNYNGVTPDESMAFIIPYQVITGNYNVPDVEGFCSFIIPYQVITGNYNKCR